MVCVYMLLVYSWLGLNQVSMKENKTCKDQTFYQAIKMALSEMYIHIIMLICSKTITDADTQHNTHSFSNYYLYLFFKTQQMTAHTNSKHIYIQLHYFLKHKYRYQHLHTTYLFNNIF